MKLLTTLTKPISLPPMLKVAISMSGLNHLTYLSLTAMVTKPEQAFLKNFPCLREHVQFPLPLCRTPASIAEAYDPLMAADFFTIPFREMGLLMSGGIIY